MSGLIPTKLCPDCDKEKPTEAFGRNKRLKDGLARYCKECFQRRSRASYRKRMSERGKQVRERPDEFLDRRIVETEGLDVATRDFLAGMTDRFAVTLYERLFIPKPWVGPMAWDQL